MEAADNTVTQFVETDDEINSGYMACTSSSESLNEESPTESKNEDELLSEVYTVSGSYISIFTHN